MLSDFKHFLRVCRRLRGLLGRAQARRFALATLRRDALLEVDVPGLAHPLWLRPGTSDVNALWHVFGLRDCDVSVDREPRLVIDGGANVGYASVLFASRWPRARILAVEPDHGNCEMIRRNCAPYPGVEIIEAALWPASGLVAIENPRDASWAFRVGEVDRDHPNAIPAVTPPDLIEIASVDRAEVVKLDIEGAEERLFGDGDLRWLDSVDVLVIETHGERAERVVAEAMRERGFASERKGEKLVFRRIAV